MPFKPSKPLFEVKNLEDGLTLDELARIHPARLLATLFKKGITMGDILLYRLELKNAEMTFASDNPDKACDEILTELDIIRKRRKLLERILGNNNDDQPGRFPLIPTDVPQVVPYEDAPAADEGLPPQVTDPDLNPYAPRRRRKDKQLPN